MQQNPRQMTLQLARDPGVPEVAVIRTFPPDRVTDSMLAGGRSCCEASKPSETCESWDDNDEMNPTSGRGAVIHGDESHGVIANPSERQGRVRGEATAPDALKAQKETLMWLETSGLPQSNVGRTRFR